MKLTHYKSHFMKITKNKLLILCLLIFLTTVFFIKVHPVSMFNEGKTNALEPTLQPILTNVEKATVATTNNDVHNIVRQTKPIMLNAPQGQNHFTSAIANISQSVYITMVTLTPNFYATIYDNNYLRLIENYYTPPKQEFGSNGDAVVGSLGTTTFVFIPIKIGSTTIQFKNSYDLADTGSNSTINLTIDK